MITKNTVFILGAGASCPIYPTGPALLGRIITNLSGGDKYKELLGMGYKEKEIAGLLEVLKLSGKDSIDAALRHRSEYLSIGKVAIAQVLIPCENANQEIAWYRYLFGLMDASSFHLFTYNKISFITFNYDRSLENFLCTSLRHLFGKSEVECAEALKSINIFHIHGMLSYLPWQNKDGRAYSPIYNIGDLTRAADSIRIVYEEDKLHHHIPAILQAADNIYFLGFGYHKENLNKLDIINTISSSKLVNIMGTTFELQPGEVNDIALYFINKHLDLENIEILPFLRKVGRSHMGIS